MATKRHQFLPASPATRWGAVLHLQLCGPLTLLAVGVFSVGVSDAARAAEDILSKTPLEITLSALVQMISAITTMATAVLVAWFQLRGKKFDSDVILGAALQQESRWKTATALEAQQSATHAVEAAKVAASALQPAQTAPARKDDGFVVTRAE